MTKILRSLGLGSLLRLGLLLLLLALTTLTATLGLEVLVVDGKSLINLGTESRVILKAKICISDPFSWEKGDMYTYR